MNMENKLKSKSQGADFDWMGALFFAFLLLMTFCLLRRESEQVCERERKQRGEKTEEEGGKERRREGKPKQQQYKNYYGLGE